MSNIPAAVRKQGERAEELLKNAQTPSEQIAPNESEKVQEPEPNKDPEKVTQEPDYAQAYRTLQGKYNAEVPRLTQQLAEANKRAEDMERQIGELNAKLSEMAAAPKSDAVKTLEDAGYDDDVVSAFKAQNEQIQALMKRNEDLVAQVRELYDVKERVERTEQEQVMTAAQRFVADLDSAVPEWRETNDNPEFHAFLLQEDGFSGLTRQDVLSNAEQRRDAATVIKLFKAFKDAKPKRKENIAPANGNHAAAPDGGRIFSRAEVAQFYGDLARGRIKHGPEAQAKEAEILKAQQEGRIR